MFEHNSSYAKSLEYSLRPPILIPPSWEWLLFVILKLGFVISALDLGGSQGLKDQNRPTCSLRASDLVPAALLLAGSLRARNLSSPA